MIPLTCLSRVVEGVECAVLFDTRMMLRQCRLVVAHSDHHCASREPDGDTYVFLEANWVHDVPAIHTETLLTVI